MPKYTTRFFAFPGQRERPHLNVRIINPFNGKELKWMCLVDTGADSCIIGEDICTLLGHDLKGDGVKSSITCGISGEDTIVWKHTFMLQLLHPNTGEVIWDSGKQLIDCVDVRYLPVLLGTEDFLRHFIVTFDYPNSQIIVEL